MSTEDKKTDTTKGRILLPDDGTVYKFTTFVDAIMYFDKGKPLHELSDRELDFLYAAVFGRLAYYMTRVGYIHYLENKRTQPK